MCDSQGNGTPLPPLQRDTCTHMQHMILIDSCCLCIPFTVWLLAEQCSALPVSFTTHQQDGKPASAHCQLVLLAFRFILSVLHHADLLEFSSFASSQGSPPMFTLSPLQLQQKSQEDNGCAQQPLNVIQTGHCIICMHTHISEHSDFQCTRCATHKLTVYACIVEAKSDFPSLVQQQITEHPPKSCLNWFPIHLESSMSFSAPYLSVSYF